ncbi:hypothetical protein E8E12_008032 [Didymella heteroderae]|uniref:WW domain-containing protein n=1 Tax=Didymella heteroderae TaxID=1769908 RepID=A0A9P4WPG4_9PLEO|nr:hypothetical protein E8E12_008032 [Didymella heteroderae]
MNFQTAPPTNLPAVPPGWKAEWSAQYARYFYVNLNTNESVWILPTVQPTHVQTPQPVIQRKPVPTLCSDPQGMVSHFPRQPSQVQYPTSVQPPLQQHNTPAQSYQNFSPPPTPGGSQQHYGYVPSNAQYAQPHQQNFTQAPSPTPYNPQPCVPTPPIEEQRPHYDTPSANSNAYFVPPPTGANNAQQPQYNNINFAPPPQQPSHYSHQARSYQPAPPPTQHQQPQRPSTFASLSSNSTLNKWSSKLSQLQNKPSTTATSATARSAPANAQPQSAPTAGGGDWKKWTKRAAIGVAAVGAMALGVDAIGDAGASAFGGGDFGGGGGGDWSGGGDFGAGDVGAGSASEAVDASAAQIAMEQQGQQNASMLLDPAGTTYTVVDGNSLI